MSASKPAIILASLGGWVLVGLIGCCGPHRNCLDDSHNCYCRSPQCQAVPHVIEEAPVEEAVPSGPSENPLVPAPPSGATVPYERFDHMDEAARLRDGTLRDPATMHDGFAPPRSPVAEPRESQRSLIPRSFKRPKLLEKLGAPFRHILHRFRNQDTSPPRHARHVHEYPGTTHPQDIRRPEPADKPERQAALRKSTLRPVQLPLAEGRTARTDAESREPLVRLKRPRARESDEAGSSEKTESSIVWGTHSSRQGYPSSSRAPLMRVPPAPRKIEVWPPRRQQPDASEKEEGGIPSLEALGGGHTPPDLQTPGSPASPRTAERSPSR